IICPECRSSFRMPARKSFLGFRKYRCPACSSKVIYPLTPAYRVIWWVGFGIVVVAALLTVTRQVVAIPGLLGIVAVFAVISDLRIRKKVHRLAELGPQQVAQPAPGTQPEIVCPKCGTANTDGARFCSSCGTALARVSRRMAKASLVLGILGCIFGPFTTIPGFVLGIVALRRIKRGAERLRGKGLAIGGICVSAVLTLLYFAIILVRLIVRH
ncbi:MAG: DUF4190 domain-containing protein, partial [Phycisphaerae bacterium]|nr:DUF4190 domain-containing protein [Phycisphaerae bacterium]